MYPSVRAPECTEFHGRSDFYSDFKRRVPILIRLDAGAKGCRAPSPLIWSQRRCSCALSPIRGGADGADDSDEGDDTYLQLLAVGQESARFLRQER